jgi:hypothetical protein
MKKQKSLIKENIFDLLKGLKDHRRGQGKRHALQTSLLTIIMAIMAGAKSERAISRFIKNNQESLIELIGDTGKKMPSRSVIRGLIQNIDFKELEEVFRQWSAQFVSVKKGEWISLDGKAVRGTFAGAGDKMNDFVSLVTAFASERKQVLFVGKINSKKENEIPVVRDLIKMLDLQDVIFTLDALHCQSKTVKTIIDTKNNYLIGVKENQSKLLKQIKKTARNLKPQILA